MSVQLSFFEIEKRGRVRYIVPTYIKFYSIWQYDRDKFKKLLDEWLRTEEGKNRTYQTLERKQNEILEKCYLRDKEGRKLRDSDESHIYRIRTLHKLHQALYDKIAVFFLFKEKNINGIIIDEEAQEAEIKGTWQMSIKQRVIIHIRLLRLLEKGFSVEEALWQIKSSSISGITENTMTATKNLLTSH